MKRFISVIAMGMFWWAQTAAAQDFFNVRLRVDLKYEAYGEKCRLHALFPHYSVAAKISGHQMTRAQLTKLNVHGEPQTYDLNDDELRGIDLRREQNLTWMKSLTVSPEILQRLITTSEGLGRYDQCLPPKDVVYDHVGMTHFDFVIEEVGDLLPHLINSKPVVITGHKQNGDLFKIEITLTQDRT